MGKRTIFVAKNDGGGDEWKPLEVETSEGWDAVKTLVANSLYTEMDLFIITGPADLTLYAVPGGANIEVSGGGPEAALAAMIDGSKWALDICGGPFVALEDVMIRTDEAIIQARDLIGSPIRGAVNAGYAGSAQRVVGGGGGRGGGGGGGGATTAAAAQVLAGAAGGPATPPPMPAHAIDAAPPSVGDVEAMLSNATISSLLGANAAPGTPPPAAANHPATPSLAASPSSLTITSPSPTSGAMRDVKLRHTPGGPWHCQCINHRIQLSADPLSGGHMEQVRVIEPGQMFRAVERLEVAPQRGPGQGPGQVFYKVHPYNGWVFKFDREGEQVVAEVEEPYMTYRVAEGAEADGGAAVHDDQGAPTGKRIPVGTDFEAASTVRFDGSEQVHYRLADFSGWVYRFGEKNKSVPAVLEVPNAPMVCRVRNRHVNVRVTADLKSALIEPLVTLGPGEQFTASRRVVVPNGGGQRFYKLCGVDGWLFRMLEDGTQVVDEVSKPPLKDDCVIM